MRVYVELIGGTGNQMFGFAHAIAYAKKNNIKKIVIVTSKSLYKHEGLCKFLLDFPIGTQKKCTVINQRGWTFSEMKYPVIKNSNVFLRGYYQSSKFFKNVDAYISSFYMNKLATYLPFHIEQGSLSIHIRRGDYTNLQQCHPVMSHEYYSKALNVMKDLYVNVYVFSDDIEWCKSQTWLNNLLNVSFPTLDVYATLACMINCDYHIIANSTLSWWGAYLSNKRHDKVRVVAPKKWFGPAIKHDTSDMYERNWIIV